MYNEKIENLINFALADGELTEKEKQILFKKAEEEGIDLDEFEMVLDAKLHEKKQNMKEPVPPTTAAPKSNKFGDVKRCPACGAIVTSFSAKCGDCGHEFSIVESNVSINKLFEKINEIESNKREESTSSNPFKALGRAMSDSFQTGADKTSSRIMATIQNFPVPNTKEDLLEFLSLAFPLASKKITAIPGFGKSAIEIKNEKEMRNVWKNKCEQLIIKARFSMKEDKITLDEINNYAKELKN